MRDPEPTFEFETRSGPVDMSRRLLYLWEVFDADGKVVYCYVGKSERGAGRPLSDYRRNVDNLLNHRPYRPKNPDGFRQVHKQLAEAARQKQKIRLTFLRNVLPEEDIFEAERQTQVEYKLK
jgi:hypothetical protein